VGIGLDANELGLRTLEEILDEIGGTVLTIDYLAA
jgi:hypothetical protein